MLLRPTIQLLRLDKPIGIWLLFFPASWAVVLAAPRAAIAPLLLVMLAGAAITRAAGCILNDLADRRLDAQVARTQHRPLAAGTLSVPYAVGLLTLLLGVALLLALTLPRAVFWLSLVAVPMIAAYPWMKRITWWPQLFLGLTFNLGVLFGWLATGNPLSAPAFALYAAAICWTLGYDTIYAVQDMADDARVGIRSTARRVGRFLPAFITVCYGLMLLLLLTCFVLLRLPALAYLGLVLVGLHAVWQIRQLPVVPARAGAIFVSNQWLGLVLLIALLLARFLMQPPENQAYALALAA